MDTIYGTTGNDSLVGNAGDELMYGGLGNDTMYGAAGNDSLHGSEDDDELHGNEDNDFLIGNDGNDIIYGDGGDDTMNGGLDNDTLFGGIGNDWLHGGDEGNDELHGNEGNDLFYGYIGYDTLYGDDGDDYIDGDENDDILYGGLGNDTVLGGNSVLGGDVGGNDTLYGDEGNDHLNGIDGDDFLYGGSGNDSLYDIGGNDVMHGGLDNDSLFGAAGSDSLHGDEGNDELHGNEDNDLLYGGSGNDTLYGGIGYDTAVFSGNFADYFISYDASISTYIVVDSIIGRDGIDSISGVEYFQFIDTIVPVTGLLSLDLLDTTWSNDSDDIYRAAGNATLGLLSGNSSMLNIQNATYVLSDDTLIIDGTFNSIIDGTSLPLFTGIATFDIRSGKASLTIDKNLYSPASLVFDFTTLDLSKNYLDIHFSPIKLPSGISDTNLTVASDSIVINENGLQFGINGSVNFPDKTFELFDMLTVHAYDWSVSYDSPDNELHILGGFELQTGWDNVPCINAELTGDGLVIRNGEFADVALTITLDDFSVKGWGFNNVSVTLDTEKNSIVGSAGIKLPMFASSLETTIGFIVNPFELDTALFHIPFINPGVALGTTGWFLTAIDGGVSNLANSNKEPLLFEGGIELQLPEVIDLNVNGELDSKHIAGFVEGTIIDKDAIYFKGQIILNWNKGYVKINSSASFAQGHIVGSFDFTGNLNLDFTANGSATVKFDTIDKTLSGHYYLNYSNDHKNSNDYIAAWVETVLYIPVFGDKTVTIGTKYSFDGTWRTFGAAEVPLYSSWIVDETISDLMVTVNWDNPVNDVETRVIVYDDLEKTKIREIISEAEYGEHDIAIISEWSGSTAKVIYINTPEAGLWDVEIVNSDGLGEVVYNATTSLKPLALTLGELYQNNDQLSLGYTTHTPETDGVISFYLDNNDNGFDGQMIESMADLDGDGQWVWNTTGFHGGTYWLYATLADGKSVPIMSYAAQSIFINNAPVAYHDMVSTNENLSIIIDVLSNDSDFDDNSLSIKSITNPLNGGTVSIVNNNQILFIPDANTYGESSFSYTIDDGNGGENTALVTVFIDTRPCVVSLDLVSGSYNAAFDSNIVLTFNEAIQAGTGDIVITDGSDDVRTIAVTDATQVTFDGNTVTINPTTDLAKGTHYFVTITDGAITDLSGNNYAGTTSYDFTTIVSGIVTTDFGGSDSGSSIALQSDGKIIVAGESSGVGDGGFAVVRYNADGSLDITFDGDGKVTTDFGGFEYATSVALQDDGKIVVAGYKGISSSGGDDFALVRYNADGSLDTAFDGDGKVTTDFGGWDEAESVTIDSNGKIVVAGYTDISSSGGGDFAVVRYNIDGSLDSSFGANHNGKIITNVGVEEYAHSVLVQADNKIVVIGDTATSSSGASDFALVRYNADGSLDTSFGEAGTVTTNFDFADFVGGATMQSDGKIVVVGESYSLADMAVSGDQDFVLVRYNTDGSLDQDFGTDGKVITDFGGGESATSVAMQADGKIVVTGNSFPAGGSGSGSGDGDIVVRYHTDGTLDTTFSNDGIVKTLIGDSSEANSVVVQSDGRILVAGQSEADGNPDFTLVRYNSNGSMALGIAFDGTPVDNAMANETFTDFYVDTTQLNQQGYFASMIAPDSSHSIIHLYDDNSDGFPDRFIDNDESGTIVWNSNGTWTAVITSGGDGGGNGRLALDADGNMVGLYAAMDNMVDTLTNNTLTFDMGTTGATLATSGTITLWSSATGTLTIAVASLTFDGSYLTIPLSGTDAATQQPYYLSPNSVNNLRVQIPAGVVIGQSTIDKAWFVGTQNDGSYSLSPMMIVYNGEGTSAADWVLGTPGNDIISAGAGDDLMRWSGGNDTIDAGDGFDKLYMPKAVPSTTYIAKTDSQGVLHIGEVKAATNTIIADAYRITRLSTTSFQLQKMDAAGTTVAQTMQLNNAETLHIGPASNYLSVALKISYTNEAVYGTPWRDTISLNASNISTLSQIWGYSGTDTLSVDLGAGYSKIEVVSDGSASLLKGTLISDGTVVELGSFSKALPSQYNYTATMSIGTGESAYSFTVNNIEAYHFTSGGVVLDVDPIPPTVTTFSPADAAMSVPVGSDITLTFSENIQRGSGTIAIHSGSANGTVVASYDVSTSSNLAIVGNTLTINPTADLAKGTHYFVTLDAGSIEDLAGNDYAGTTSYDFTTIVSGVITTDFGSDDSFGCGVTIQADSKIVVVGSYMNEKKMDVALVRYNPDGTLDTSFGGGTGKLTTDFGYEDAGLCTIIQSDGKILVIGESAINGGSYGKCIIARYNIDGSFDTSFDGDGKVITNFLDGLNVDGFYTTDAILQSDGKILIVGGGYQSGNSLVTLFRYNSNGSLDSSFGNNGMVITPSISSLNSSDFPYGVVQQADEKILVAVRSADNVNITLIRYNIDGTVDTGFNAASVEVTGLKENDIDGGLVLQGDGKILVSGSSHGNIVLLRYNSNGTLDNTFNGSGNVVTDLGGDDGVGAITLQTDGKILVSGYSNNDLALLRYNTDGTPDTHFGNTGIALTNIGSDSLHRITFAGWGITVQADGKIIVSGESNGDFAVVRYNTDGTLDASFDGASDTTAPTLVSATPADTAMSVPVGSDITLTFSEAIQFGAGNIVISNGLDDVRTIEVNDITQIAISGNTLNINPTADLAKGTHYFVTFEAGSIEDLVGNDYAGTTVYDFTTRVGGLITTDFGSDDFGFSMAIQSDGKVIVAGISDGDFALARYNQNGSHDASFEIDGKVTTDFGGYDGGFDVTVQLDGKILVSGSSNGDFALARYNIDGSLDTSFSGDGKVITELGGDDTGTGVTIQSDGKILLSGFSNEDFALVRYNSDGTLDASFSGDGIVITNIGNEDYASGVAVQADGKILVAGSTWLGNGNGNFALVRYNPDGSLDTSFSGDGIVTADINYRDQGIGMTLQHDGKIIVVGESNGDFAVVRYNTNGSLDTSFSGDGIVTTDVSNYDSAWSAVVQSDGKILVAGYVNGGIDQPFSMQSDGILVKERDSNFALIRYNSDGSLDTSFGNGGVVITDFGYNDIAFGIALQDDGKIVLSGGSNGDFAIVRYNSNGTLDMSFDDASEPSPITHDLSGNITFWKGGAAITDVTTTLSSKPIAGTQLVDFRDIHTNADGSHTVEIWATSSSDIASIQLEFMLSTGAVASWNSGDGLPAEWMSAVNMAIGQFQLASITGATALPAGTLKLGTLTVTAPTSTEHLELLLNSGTLGNNAVATTGIVFDSTTTGSDASYHYLDVHDGLYSLMAERHAGTAEHSAVTAADALAALKMAVGLNPNDTGAAVSFCQYLAADVNHDGKIRSTDAFNILKMAVGLETAPHDEWIFVPESVGSETMTRNHVDWSEAAIAVDLYENMELDLVGIVKGDVNGSWGA